MKYKAKQIKNGKDAGMLAVFAGSKYFLKSITTDAAACALSAAEHNARYYQSLLDNAHNDWDKAALIVKPKYDFGDILA